MGDRSRDQNGRWKRGNGNGSSLPRLPFARSVHVERDWITSRQAAYLADQDRRRAEFTRRVEAGDPPGVARSLQSITRLLSTPNRSYLDAETPEGLHQKGQSTDRDVDLDDPAATGYSLEDVPMKDRVVFGAQRRPGVISDRKLAEATGYTPAHISYLMTGKRNPSLECLSRLAVVLQCSLDEVHQYIQERVRGRYMNRSDIVVPVPPPRVPPPLETPPTAPKTPSPDPTPVHVQKLQIGLSLLEPDDPDDPNDRLTDE